MYLSSAALRKCANTEINIGNPEMDIGCPEIAIVSPEMEIACPGMAIRCPGTETVCSGFTQQAMPNDAMTRLCEQLVRTFRSHYQCYA